MLYSLADVIAMRRIFEMSEGDAEFKRIQGRKLDALLGYCESAACRRKLLLNYFGEAHDGRCGSCGNCLEPCESWDGTIAAQKALSCVYRTGQRFGAGHLADVLMGRRTAKVDRWGHGRIKTFGVGKELDKTAWMSVFRQLLSAGLLSVDLGQVAGLRLTAESRPVLRGAQKVFFRTDTTASAVRRRKPASTAAAFTIEDGESEALFETLRQLRLEIARRLEVPPYVIFHDNTLKEMAALKPATEEQFLAIKGVGAAKARRYSAVFLDCIRTGQVDLSRHMDRIIGVTS
jgi:ATP-dependent DNA helicase RecQ